MIGKIVAELKEAHRKVCGPPDPPQFDDPVAANTEWTSVSRSAFGPCAPRLVRFADRIEFQASGWVKPVLLFFLCISLSPCVMSWVAFTRGDTALGAGLIAVSMLFVVGIVLLWREAEKTIVFDRRNGFFWKGRSPLSHSPAPDSSDDHAALGQIYALQLIIHHPSSGGGRNYELNLVLHDGHRINVFAHGRRERLRDDATTLAEFLGVPVWDNI